MLLRSLAGGLRRLRAGDPLRRHLRAGDPLAAVNMHRSDQPGTLSPVLENFNKLGLNLAHKESQLHQYSFGDATLEFEFEGEGGINDSTSQNCIHELMMFPEVNTVRVVTPLSVPWFPMSPKELDGARTTLDGGTALISEDHPGFNDPEYRKRRNTIVENARQHCHGQSIPVVYYTDEEHITWTTVFDKVQDLQRSYACDDFKDAMEKFNRHGVLTRERIPQLEEVSELLHSATGFRVRPVQGLLTARDFLNALAFRVFWSTQYIRHPSNPFFTPEPDVCHELLGHVPLFAHPDFADFSQTIGLASLGATDEQIDRLATLYWFTIECGLLQDPVNKRVTAYGAAVLSSFGELEWACAPSPSEDCRKSGGLQAYDRTKSLKNPKISPLVAEITSQTPFPISTYQPQYFASPSLHAAKMEVKEFCSSLKKPFICWYDPLPQSIKVTPPVKRMEPNTDRVQEMAERQADFFQNLKKAEAAGENLKSGHNI